MAATQKELKTRSGSGTSGAALPRDRWAASRVARRLASKPMSMYLWLSGPGKTARERTRFELDNFNYARALTPLGR